MRRRDFIKRCFQSAAGVAVAPVVAKAVTSAGQAVTGGYEVPPQFAAKLMAPGRRIVSKPGAIPAFSRNDLAAVKVASLDIERVSQAFGVRLQELISSKAN